MAKKDKTLSVPDFPGVSDALAQLLQKVLAEVERVQGGLPPELQLSTEQLVGAINRALTTSDFAGLYELARADIFNLVLTGKSNIRHDPVDLA